MLKYDHVEIYGLKAAIRGMRNPMNSWDRSDTAFYSYPDNDPDSLRVHDIGPNDMKLMKSLVAGGPVHSKFMRMLTVTADITAPLYWWKEYDTYKVGTVANSCSTMHKIAAKAFTLDDFSHEHLIGERWSEADNFSYYTPCEVLEIIIDTLNNCRNLYLKAKEAKDEPRAKLFWWQMIQLLPSSYNQKRTIQFNYEVAKNIYTWRHNHKLDEWHTFCDMIRELPYAKELIIGEEKE